MEINVNFKLLKIMFDDLGYTTSSIKVGYFRDVTANDFNILLAQGIVLQYEYKTLSEKWDLVFKEFKTSYKKLNLTKGKHGGYTSNSKLFVLTVLSINGSWIQLDDNTAISEMMNIKREMEQQIEQIYDIFGV